MAATPETLPTVFAEHDEQIARFMLGGFINSPAMLPSINLAEPVAYGNTEYRQLSACALLHAVSGHEWGASGLQPGITIFRPELAVMLHHPTHSRKSLVTQVTFADFGLAPDYIEEVGGARLKNLTDAPRLRPQTIVVGRSKAHFRLGEVIPPNEIHIESIMAAASPTARLAARAITALGMQLQIEDYPPSAD